MKTDHVGILFQGATTRRQVGEAAGRWVGARFPARGSNCDRRHDRDVSSLGEPLSDDRRDSRASSRSGSRKRAPPLHQMHVSRRPHMCRGRARTPSRRHSARISKPRAESTASRYTEIFASLRRWPIACDSLAPSRVRRRKPAAPAGWRVDARFRTVSIAQEQSCSFDISRLRFGRTLSGGIGPRAERCCGHVQRPGLVFPSTAGGWRWIHQVRWLAGPEVISSRSVEAVPARR